MNSLHFCSFIQRGLQCLLCPGQEELGIQLWNFWVPRWLFQVLRQCCQEYDECVEVNTIQITAKYTVTVFHTAHNVWRMTFVFRSKHMPITLINAGVVVILEWQIYLIILLHNDSVLLCTVIWNRYLFTAVELWAWYDLITIFIFHDLEIPENRFFKALQWKHWSCQWSITDPHSQNSGLWSPPG